MQSEQAKERRRQHVVDIQRVRKCYLTGTGNVRISYAVWKRHSSTYVVILLAECANLHLLACCLHFNIDLSNIFLTTKKKENSFSHSSASFVNFDRRSTH